MDLDMRSNFNDVIHQIEEIGAQYAEAKAQSWQLQELCSVVKARLCRYFMNEGNSAQKSENLAKAHPDYEKHLLGTSAAIQKELSLKAQYERNKAAFEALRSLSSLEKSTRQYDGS